jgi:hypothetical protein
VAAKDLQVLDAAVFGDGDQQADYAAELRWSGRGGIRRLGGVEQFDGLNPAWLRAGCGRQQKAEA